MLVVCGSATTWIAKKILSDKGGLFNRAARRIYLMPFTLQETERYPDLSPADLNACCLALTGISHAEKAEKLGFRGKSGFCAAKTRKMCVKCVCATAGSTNLAETGKWVKE